MPPAEEPTTTSWYSAVSSPSQGAALATVRVITRRNPFFDATNLGEQVGLFCQEGHWG